VFAQQLMVGGSFDVSCADDWHMAVVAAKTAGVGLLETLQLAAAWALMQAQHQGMLVQAYCS
jgi:hypothetical protein